jgi:hypothetical protein
MSLEAEIIAARLTRIKTLLDALERECLDSGPTRETFLKLEQELEAVRTSGQPARPMRP